MRFNLRFENNLNSIASLMREMQVHKTSLTLWQNQTGNRILSQAFIKHLDSNHNVITLNPFKKNFLSFKPDDLIFCHTEFKSIVFKTSIKTLDANLLNCSIPESLRLLELRTEPRVNFGLEFNPPEIMTENNDVFRLFDLSPSGASFIIPRNLLGKFFIDDRMVVHTPPKGGSSLVWSLLGFTEPPVPSAASSDPVEEPPVLVQVEELETAA
jgi:hypothetical protein